MRRLLCAAVLVLFVAACGNEAQPETTPPEPTPVNDPEPTPTPTPTPDPDPDPAPLTGLPVEEPEVLDRPVLAVKVDNLQPARPQTGLEHADIVMVELVESATRFVALYQSTDPGVVGPVRSGRLAEADLLPPFQPVFVMSGAHGPVGQELRSALDVVLEEGQGAGWFRESSRPSPHNLYATATDLWTAAPEQQVVDAFWEFDEDAPEGGQDTDTLTATYPRAGASGWEWDDGQGAWLRSQDGAAHVTADGERITAENVAVVRMEPTGNERRPFEPIGEGEATVFRGGQRFEARWSKPSRDAHIELTTPGGEPFPMQPGTTWLELLPTNGTLDVASAAH